MLLQLSAHAWLNTEDVRLAHDDPSIPRQERLMLTFRNGDTQDYMGEARMMILIWLARAQVIVLEGK